MIYYCGNSGCIDQTKALVGALGDLVDSCLAYFDHSIPDALIWRDVMRARSLLSPATPAAAEDWSHRCPECGAPVCSHAVKMAVGRAPATGPRCERCGVGLDPHPIKGTPRRHGDGCPDAQPAETGRDTLGTCRYVVGSLHMGDVATPHAATQHCIDWRAVPAETGREEREAMLWSLFLALVRVHERLGFAANWQGSAREFASLPSVASALAEAQSVTERAAPLLEAISNRRNSAPPPSQGTPPTNKET